MQLGAGVERLVKGPKGRIILECEKIKDREILKEAITEKLGTQYKIYEPNKKFPKIKSVTASSEMPGQGFLRAPQESHKSATRRPIPTGIPPTKRHAPGTLVMPVLKAPKRPLISVNARELRCWSFAG